MNLILATSFVGQPVVDKQNKKFGSVTCTLFNTDNGSMIGLMVKKNMFSQTLFVNFEDVDDFYHSHIQLKESDDIKPIKKNDLANKMKKNGGRLIGLKVVTESGKRIGKLEDLAVSLQFGAVAKFYVRNLLSRRIIDRDDIVEITKRKIVIKDDIPIASTEPNIIAS